MCAERILTVKLTDNTSWLAIIIENVAMMTAEAHLASTMLSIAMSLYGLLARTYIDRPDYVLMHIVNRSGLKCCKCNVNAQAKKQYLSS